jgi:hypothetical protein
MPNNQHNINAAFLKAISEANKAEEIRAEGPISFDNPHIATKIPKFFHENFTDATIIKSPDSRLIVNIPYAPHAEPLKKAPLMNKFGNGIDNQLQILFDKAQQTPLLYIDDPKLEGMEQIIAQINNTCWFHPPMTYKNDKIYMTSNQQETLLQLWQNEINKITTLPQQAPEANEADSILGITLGEKTVQFPANSRTAPPQSQIESPVENSVVVPFPPRQI